MRFFFFLLAMATGFAQRPTAPPVALPLIIDTDAGPDDLIAILWLVRQPGVQIEAVTVGTGLAHPRAGAESVLRILEAAGLVNVPVFAGSDRPVEGTGAFPEEWRKSADQLLRDELPQAKRRPEEQLAGRFLSARLADRQRPVRILALGPLTNLARALRIEPRTGTAVHELIWMGGALHVEGNVPAAPKAEWNAWVDPEAAERVLDSGWRVRVVPLDATNKVPIDASVLNLFEEQAREWAATIVLRILRAEAPAIRKGEYFAWDLLAAMSLTSQDLLRYHPVAVAVRKRTNERGRLVRVDGQRPNATVALEADRTRFRQLFATLLP